MSDRCEKTNGDAPGRSAVARMLAKMIEKNRAQERALEGLARRVEAEEAEARQREAELADRLVEARNELADAHAAMEREREKRAEAERIAAEAREAIEQAKKIFDAIQTPSITSATAPEPSVDVERSEVEDVTPGESAGKSRAEGDVVDPASKVGPLGVRVEVENIGLENQAAVPMTIALSPAETASLAERAAEEGFTDGASFAVHLIREFLRQAAQPAGEARAVAAAGSG